MSAMPLRAKTFRLALLIAAVPATAAQAQYASSPPPLYPYAVQNGYGVQTAQPYAVQVAPNTYVIQRPAPQRNYPYVSGSKRTAHAAPAPGKFDRPHKPVDHALVQELRQRVQKKNNEDQASVEPVKKSTTNTTKIIRHAPVVRETHRYVDDPPRVIDQVTVDDSEETPNRGLLTQPRRGTQRNIDIVTPDTAPPRAVPADKSPRVISADAEVTILGPDRMSIRLFRKGQGPRANARAD
jgi:chorismate mutase